MQIHLTQPKEVDKMAGMNRKTGRIVSGNVSDSRASSVLNPSMSRSGFVKTLGAGIAGLGMAASGLGGVARAHTPPAENVYVRNASWNGSAWVDAGDPTVGSSAYLVKPFNWAQEYGTQTYTWYTPDAIANYILDGTSLPNPGELGTYEDYIQKDNAPNPPQPYPYVDILTFGGGDYGGWYSADYENYFNTVDYMLNNGITPDMIVDPGPLDSSDLIIYNNYPARKTRLDSLVLNEYGSLINPYYHHDVTHIQWAVDNAASNGTLLLKSTNPTGAQAPFFFIKRQSVETPVLRSPRGTSPIYGDYSLPEILLPAGSPLWVVIDDKALTIKGETDINGVPLTAIHGTADQASFVDSMAAYYYNILYLRGMLSGGFMPTGGEKVRFEGLSFKYMANWAAIYGIGPAVEVVNCIFDFANGCVTLAPDDENPNACLISNCVFSNYLLWSALVKGSTGSVFQDCRCVGTSFEFNHPNFTEIGASFWGNTNSSTTPFVGHFHCTTLKDFTIKNCAFDFTGSSLPFSCAVTSANSLGGTVENCSVQNCTFTNCNCSWSVLEFAYAGDIDHGVQVQPGTATLCTAINNTFTGCGSPYGIIQADGIYSPYTGELIPAADNLVSGNTFLNCTRGPAVRFGYTSLCQSVKNDYRKSNLPTIAEAGASRSALRLRFCDHCTIFESGMFPPGKGGASNFVSVPELDSNRIIGDRANTVDQPAGIGQLEASLAKEKKNELLAMDSFKRKTRSRPRAAISKPY